MKNISPDVLNGKVIKKITGLEQYSEAVIINTECGCTLKFYHEQQCCENVLLEDFEGDADALVGATIINAEECSSDNKPIPDDADEYGTWTFYKVETTKGELWLRWLGESNGYYSERVDLHYTEA